MLSRRPVAPVQEPSTSNSLEHCPESIHQPFGCTHYKRNCALVAPCCNKIYTCRLCHDEQEHHKIDRYQVWRCHVPARHPPRSLPEALAFLLAGR